jgi:tetratricopeptide (TPR) repeat protein
MSTNVDNSNPQAGAGRPLPKKEADLFKNVVKHYEQKQYKKAIKQADTILKKFPKHGETLAMKGLTLNYMSKREEAHALVKEGLTNDMRYANKDYSKQLSFFFVCTYVSKFLLAFAFSNVKITCLLACVRFTASLRS